jgi:hypothetical protein
VQSPVIDCRGESFTLSDGRARCCLTMSLASRHAWQIAKKVVLMVLIVVEDGRRSFSLQVYGAEFARGGVIDLDDALLFLYDAHEGHFERGTALGNFVTLKQRSHLPDSVADAGACCGCCWYV